MLYTHVAAALAAAAIAATGAWQIQNWRLGGQIARIQAEQAQAVADARAAAAHETARLQAQKDEALYEAAQHAQRNAAAAAAARRESDGLRAQLAEARLRMSSSTCASVREHAGALATVFEQCSGAVEDLARAADGHATDARTLIRAWPR